MTDKELAKQAGYKDLPTVRLAFYGFDKEKFADLIRADEREACAKVCEGLADVHEKANQWGSHKTADALAQAIRARGDV